MQSKWRAPACYVGVAVICALYLSIVPGVRFTDVCAGAGLGAAVMWAINEWEVGKWNIPLPTLVLTPAPAAALATAQAQASSLVAAPAATVQAETATPMAASPTEPAIEVSVVVTEQESRPRVDSGVATQGTLEKWDIDEKEPSWDPSALAETWAKLRAELSINRSGKPAVSPDLPQTARLARNAPTAPKTASKPVAANSIGNKVANGKLTPGTAYASSTKGPSNAKPGAFTLGSYGQNNGTSLLAGLTSKSASASAAPVRKVAGGTSEPARQTSLLLRPGTIRPR